AYALRSLCSSDTAAALCSGDLSNISYWAISKLSSKNCWNGCTLELSPVAFLLVTGRACSLFAFDNRLFSYTSGTLRKILFANFYGNGPVFVYLRNLVVAGITDSAVLVLVKSLRQRFFE